MEICLCSATATQNRTCTTLKPILWTAFWPAKTPSYRTTTTPTIRTKRRRRRTVLVEQIRQHPHRIQVSFFSFQTNKLTSFGLTSFFHCNSPIQWDRKLRSDHHVSSISGLHLCLSFQAIAEETNRKFFIAILRPLTQMFPLARSLILSKELSLRERFKRKGTFANRIVLYWLKELVSMTPR